jgi:hypothetical protein
MGAKTGYADVILRVLGLRPGQGSADRTHYMWAEPDDGVRLLLEAYRDRELALAAAKIIRSWKDEDPKELWLRLRKEGPVKGPEVDPREVAKFLRLLTSNRLIPGTWSEDGRWVNAARDGGETTKGGVSFGGADFCTDAVTLATAINDTPTLPATITDDARKVEPPQLPAGTVAYMDPPYLNTTGYSHDLGRESVLELARKWEAAGALVCISEAEPIGALVADGWSVVEITGERKGQKRTFSKQQREFLTLSRKPAWKPAVQGQLFA